MMTYKNKAYWILAALLIGLVAESTSDRLAKDATLDLSAANVASLKYWVTDKAVQAFQYNVAFQMIIDNESSQNLNLYQAAYVRGDNWDHEKDLPWTMPTNITRKSAQGFVGHKIGNTATGCAGTVSYLIGNTKKILTIMYSVPYSHDLYSNWLGFWIHGEDEFDEFDRQVVVGCGYIDANNQYNSDLGVCPRSMVTLDDGATPSSSTNLFNKIYYNGKGKITEYYRSLPTLQYQSGGFRVEGGMGSSHQPAINVKFSGINESPTSRG